MSAGGSVTWVSTIALGLCLVTASARAQRDLPERVDAAARCYAQFDYDCVLDTLGGLVVERAATQRPRAEIELAIKLLAVSYIVRGVPERARLLFWETLQVWPDYRLEGDDLGPRFFGVFDQARAMQAGAWGAEPVRSSAPRVAERMMARDRGGTVALTIVRWSRALAMTAPRPVESTTPRPAAFRLGLGPAVAILGGHDAESLEHGLGILGRLGTERPWGLVLELAIDWQSHGLRVADLVEPISNDLDVLNLAAAVLYPFRWPRGQLHLGAGAGYSAFGFDTVFERGGLLVEAVARGEVALAGRNLLIGLEVRPRLVVVRGREGLAVSSPVLLGVTIGLGL